MKTIFLLLLVALTAVAGLPEACGIQKRRSRRSKQQGLLVRTKRRWVLSTIELQEEDKGPFPRKISTMHNNMTGHSHEFSISGMGVDSPPQDAICIHPDTGDVFALKAINREEYPNPFHIKFDIYDKNTNEKLDNELAFDVEIKDINDNAPVFAPPIMEFEVKESAHGEYLSMILSVSDKDLAGTANSKVNVAKISQNPAEPKIGLKQIDSLLKLTLEGCFDFDKAKKYVIELEAKDNGVPILSSTAFVTLHILDVNTHPPIFKKRQYLGEVNESAIIEDFLRIGVEDKDTPNTPGWRAIYHIKEGNEDDNYKIVTDRNTNEGILSVIKGKDYERTTNTTLKIEVENEAALWVCKDGTPPPHDSVDIVITVIDVNDPPEFKNKLAEVYLKEEEPPGKVLYTPEVEDIESNAVRYVLLEDPADWVRIDEKTGRITSTKAMDRESPFLNGTGTYKILVSAIDDGKPPATGTGTVLLHLADINDNKPQLVNKGAMMCGNKINKVNVSVKDDDSHPYSGPFSFILAGDDKTQERWKLEPAYGEEVSLVSRKTLAYGNYSVPLIFRDQQNMEGRDTLEVMVCDCGEKNVCRSKEPATSSLGAPGIGLLILGLLLFLLLLLLFICQCGKKFKHMPIMQDEGNQTLIKYNQEGGGSECKAEPTLLLAPVTDGIKMGTMQMSQVAPVMTKEIDTMYTGSGLSMMNFNTTSMETQRQRETLRSHRGQSMYSKWTNGNNTYQGGSSRYTRSLSMRSNYHIEDHIDRRLHMLQGNHADHPMYQPHEYAYEGQGSKCQSLDRLSLNNLGDDLNFLNDLGPKFKTLGGICQEGIQEKNIAL